MKIEEIKLAETKSKALVEMEKEIGKLESFLASFVQDEVLKVNISFIGKVDPQKRIENIFDEDGSIKPEYFGREENDYEKLKKVWMGRELEGYRENKKSKKPLETTLTFKISDQSKVKLLVKILEDLKLQKLQLIKELETLGVDTKLIKHDKSKDSN